MNENNEFGGVVVVVGSERDGGYVFFTVIDCIVREAHTVWLKGFVVLCC